MRFTSKGLKTRAAVAMTMGAFGLAAPAQAAIVYQSVSSFDRADLGDFAFNIAVGSQGGVAPRELYNTFSLTSDAIIDALDLETDSATASGFAVQLFNAAGGKPIGPLLFSQALGAPVSSVDNSGNGTINYNLHRFDLTNFNLSAGTYALGFLSSDRNQLAPVTQYTKAAATGFLADGYDGAATSGSFVTGRGTAFALIGDPIVAGAVPEPATWAMMILGFGAVGGALRRRHAGPRLTHA